MSEAGERVARELAPKFHEAYERLAPQFGYETRKDSAVPWEQVPERNRQLMEAVCKEVVAAALAACAREGRQKGYHDCLEIARSFGGATAHRIADAIVKMSNDAFEAGERAAGERAGGFAG